MFLLHNGVQRPCNVKLYAYFMRLFLQMRIHIRLISIATVRKVHSEFSYYIVHVACSHLDDAC